MTFAFGRKAYYLYWPEPDGKVVWGANLPSKEYLSFADARRIPAEVWLERLRAEYGEDAPGGAFMAAATPETLQVTGGIHLMPPVPHWYRDRMVLVGDAVHAPSNSTGQGAALAIESAVELARALRDGANHTAAFEAYQRLRKPRVERITRRGARTNSTKSPGPVAKVLMRAVLPTVMRRMDVEKTMGPEQRYRIVWDEPLVPSR